MPNIKLFYTNCSCCSGSGSGSAGVCNCQFLADGINEERIRCNGYPVVNDCKKNFVVNIYFNFSGCGSTPIGSCGSGSGSAASGPESGLDGPETGSGSDCLSVCPDCCDLIPRTLQLNLSCIGFFLITPNLIDGICGAFEYEIVGNLIDYTGCLGARNDKCTYFYIGANDALGFYGDFIIPISNGYLTGLIDTYDLFSCDPLQLNGTLKFYRYNQYPVFCLDDCLTNNFGFVIDPECITATFTITEALP